MASYWAKQLRAVTIWDRLALRWYHNRPTAVPPGVAQVVASKARAMPSVEKGVPEDIIPVPSAQRGNRFTKRLAPFAGLEEQTEEFSRLRTLLEERFDLSPSAVAIESGAGPAHQALPAPDPGGKTKDAIMRPRADPKE
eukprot:RCo027463